MKTKFFIPTLMVVMALAVSACTPVSAGLSLAGRLGSLANPTSPEKNSQSSQAPAAQTAPLSPAVPAAAEGTLEQIYEQVGPSVVNIQVSMDAVSPQVTVPGFNHPSVPGGVQSALGSGFVWDKQGRIVTNNHVVENARTIRVTFMDGSSAAAKLVGADPSSDLAVVQVNLPADQLKPVTMGDSTRVKVGQLAVAIGNPFGLEGTMTAGIVSALGRSLPASENQASGPSYTIPDVIQTDAPINPGNSGGVLLNGSGEVIGVTSAIESPVSANAGIGFVIPSAIVQRVVPVLIEKGKFEHPWLGISGGTLRPELAVKMGLSENQRGALVMDVTAGGPADRAGLRGSDQQIDIDGQQARIGGDVITSYDGQPVHTFDDLVAFLARTGQVGTQVPLEILRGGKPETVKITLGVRPDELTQANSGQNTPGNGQGSGRPGQARAYLGLNGLDLNQTIAARMGLDSAQRGVLVVKVQPGGPADKAGITGGSQTFNSNGQDIQIGGDVLTALDGRALVSMADLQRLLAGYASGDKVTFTLLRGGKEMKIEVELGQR